MIAVIIIIYFKEKDAKKLFYNLKILILVTFVTGPLENFNKIIIR